jgi:hypothetical protein
MMKRILIALLIIELVILGIYFFIKPVIVGLVKKELGKVFVQSEVSIGNCVFFPSYLVGLQDIEIKRAGVYDIKIEAALLRYKLASILKSSSRTLVLRKVVLPVDTPRQGMAKFAGYLNFGQGGAPVAGIVEIFGLDLDVKTADLTAQATLAAAGFNLVSQSLGYLDLKINSLEISGLQLEKADLVLSPFTGKGNLSIARVKYDKFGMNDIKAGLKLQDKTLSVSEISARALDGEIQGDLELIMERQARYALNLKCVALDIARLARDFKWREKFDMTGKLSGELKLKGKGAEIELLSGDFSALTPGGELIIMDTQFLENMAASTQQPVELLVENFKDYRYNTGLLTLGLEDNNVILKLALEGNAGKRNLEVILHDFKLRREEK